MSNYQADFGRKNVIIKVWDFENTIYLTFTDGCGTTHITLNQDQAEDLLTSLNEMLEERKIKQ